MARITRAAGLFALGIIITACGATAGDTPTDAPPVSEAPPTDPPPTAIPTPTIEPVESLRVPEVAATTIETIYTQAERGMLGGANTYYWPDGTLGFLPLTDGQYQVFGANGPVIARMRGTIDDPGAVVDNAALRITGTDPKFAYVAGGPLYQDAESGMILLFYHAEQHPEGGGNSFYSSLGLARSFDGGVTFEDLGIIVEPEVEADPTLPCCTDVGSATFAVKDGVVYLYYRDRRSDLSDVQLAVATAPLDEVLEAARNGTTSPWFKYNDGAQTPGLGGAASPLEIGNLPTNWFDVSYNTTLDQFIMAIAKWRGPGLVSSLYLIASPDGYHWSPRVALREVDGIELTYPTLFDPAAVQRQSGDTFYIYHALGEYGQTAADFWLTASVDRMTVTLTGAMVTLPHEWEFDGDSTEGWSSLSQIGSLVAQGGVLIVESTGNDPYMQGPSMGLSSTEFRTIEVRMKTPPAGGVGQFFFTGTDAPGTSEEASVRFTLSASDDFVTYTVDMTQSPLWSGVIDTLRFDPIVSPGTVEIDYIRVLP